MPILGQSEALLTGFDCTLILNSTLQQPCSNINWSMTGLTKYQNLSIFLVLITSKYNFIKLTTLK
jgi:hypothetical protein